MATVRATIRDAQSDVTKNIPAGQGLADTVKNHPATIELAAAASGTIIDFGRIPSNARILASSRLYNDDLATSGAATIDLGFLPVKGNTPSGDDDCLNDGIALSSASTANVGTQVVKDFSNAGKRAWELLGLTADCGGLLDVIGTVRDAATTATGTVTLDLNYKLD